MPVIAASYLGPALTPNRDAIWDEAKLPLKSRGSGQEIMGQPLRRAGRFIKMVCCGGGLSAKSIARKFKRKKNRDISRNGLGNVDEIMPFITQVFKHRRIPQPQPVRQFRKQCRRVFSGADLRSQRNRADHISGRIIIRVGIVACAKLSGKRRNRTGSGRRL